MKKIFTMIMVMLVMVTGIPNIMAKAEMRTKNLINDVEDVNGDGIIDGSEVDYDMGINNSLYGHDHGLYAKLSYPKDGPFRLMRIMWIYNDTTAIRTVSGSANVGDVMEVIDVRVYDRQDVPCWTNADLNWPY